MRSVTGTPDGSLVPLLQQTALQGVQSYDYIHKRKQHRIQLQSKAKWELHFRHGQRGLSTWMRYQ